MTMLITLSKDAAMEAISAPSSLTPLALLGLVVVQIAQLVRGHMDARAGREAKIDDSLASILQRVMDQHAASAERQAVAMERIGGTLSEVQAHMRDTNAILTALSHRMDAVERRLDQGAPLPPVKLAGRTRAKVD